MCLELTFIIAGLTYCAIGTLHFLDKCSRKSSQKESSTLLSEGGARFETLIEWLANRQTITLEEPEDSEESCQSGEQETDTKNENIGTPPIQRSQPDWENRIRSLPYLPVTSEVYHEEVKIAGFNGRTNKIADTCYCFWVTASLAVSSELVSLTNVTCDV